MNPPNIKFKAKKTTNIFPKSKIISILSPYNSFYNNNKTNNNNILSLNHLKFKNKNKLNSAIVKGKKEKILHLDEDTPIKENTKYQINLKKSNYIQSSNKDYLHLFLNKNNINTSTNFYNTCIDDKEGKENYWNYPTPEPMPIKIIKTNSTSYNFNPNFCNDNDKPNYNEQKKHGTKKRYHSNLQIYPDNNNISNKTHHKQKNNINNIIHNIECYKNQDCSNGDKKLLIILKYIGLEELYAKLISNNITYEQLFTLNKKDFIKLNIPIGYRNRLILFIDKFKHIVKNFDFDEVKNFLSLYINKPNQFININSSVFNRNKNISMKNLENTSFNNIYTYNNKINNEPKKIILNEDKKIFEDNKKSTIDIDNDNKNETVNPTIHKRNNHKETGNMKNYQTFTNLRHSSVDEHKGNNILVFKSKLEPNDGMANYKMKSYNLFQKCNNLFNEIDNFNSLYIKMKEKSQNRNKQLSVILNKRKHLEYFNTNSKINYKNKNKKERAKQNLEKDTQKNKKNDFNVLNFLKEESLRDLNKELNIQQ